MPDVLLTLPAYNEAPRLKTSIEQLQRGLTRSGWDYQILVVEDGSTDSTAEIVRSLAETVPTLKLRSTPQKLGRGRALRSAWGSISAKVYAYTDVDLPAGVEGVTKVVNEVLNGADLVTGSRYARGAFVERPPVVKLASRAYNLAIRTVFSDGVMDHQCGIKAFSPRALEIAALRARSDSWFWDTEGIILAERAGLTVREVPLRWKESRYRRTSVRRLVREAPYFLSEIVRFSGELAEVSRRPASHRYPEPGIGDRPVGRRDFSTTFASSPSDMANPSIRSSEALTKEL